MLLSEFFRRIRCCDFRRFMLCFYLQLGVPWGSVGVRSFPVRINEFYLSGYFKTGRGLLVSLAEAITPSARVLRRRRMLCYDFEWLPQNSDG